MAKEYDYKAVIERALNDLRRSRIDTRLAELREQQLCILEHNRSCKKGEAKPVLNLDHERGLYESQLDRAMKIAEHVAERAVKAFLRDAAAHGEVFDPERLAAQAIELSLYAGPFYFSCVLGKNHLAAL